VGEGSCLQEGAALGLMNMANEIAEDLKIIQDNWAVISKREYKDLKNNRNELEDLKTKMRLFSEFKEHGILDALVDHIKRHEPEPEEVE
jgi:hypothetical protein